MRRRIALFANGWGTECLQEVGHGIQKVAQNNDIDVFAFVNYSAHADKKTNQLGEFNIFTVPDLNDFDGVVVLANSFNTEIEKNFIEEVVKKIDIPAISIEAKIDGMDFVGIDDYAGMSEITEHLITKHGIKDVLFIGGIKEHEGNALRLKAVIETCEKHGVTLLGENIIYGDFAAEEAVRSLIDWRKNHALPEAIICANDIMAIGICNYLKEETMKIPDDIVVTGFDCLRIAGEYEPSITSVNRDWLKMGENIMEKLLKKMEGGQVPSEEITGSYMVIGESCGCVLDEDDVNTWKTLRERNTVVEPNGFKVDQHFRHMFISMRKIKNIDEMCGSLSYFYKKESWLEGDDVMVALVPDFFTYSGEDESNKTMGLGYPKEMDVVCLICDGKVYDHRRGKTSSVIFENANRSKHPGVYVFVPIRSDNEMYGIAMTTNGFSVVQNDVLYIMTKHMSQYLEQVKSNIAIEHLNQQLRALSVTDTLTGMYNRAGCETIIYPKLVECQKQGGRSIIMLADVDKLKQINDKYGHGAGDTAIKLSISLLKENLSDDFMIGRFGGDEFLVAAPMNEAIDADAFADKLMNIISKSPVTKEYPYDISLSIGGIQLEAGEHFSIEECLKKMDEKVYRVKKIHHDEADRKHRE